jgi:hypothetical protein
VTLPAPITHPVQLYDHFIRYQEWSPSESPSNDTAEGESSLRPPEPMGRIRGAGPQRYLRRAKALRKTIRTTTSGRRSKAGCGSGPAKLLQCGMRAAPEGGCGSGWGAATRRFRLALLRGNVPGAAP